MLLLIRSSCTQNFHIFTIIFTQSAQFLDIGNVLSIQCDHDSLETARKGQEVCIKLESSNSSKKAIGRHFEETDMLVSRVSTIILSYNPIVLRYT